MWDKEGAEVMAIHRLLQNKEEADLVLVLVILVLILVNLVLILAILVLILARCWPRYNSQEFEVSKRTPEFSDLVMLMS